MTRSHAYEGISQTLGSRDAGIVMQGLDDEAVVVRFAAAMALAELKYAPARERFLAIVRDRNADQRVVCAAIYGLHNLATTSTPDNSPCCWAAISRPAGRRRRR